MTTPKSHPPTTGSMPLDSMGRSSNRRYFAFNADVSMGTILTIVSMVSCVFTAYSAIDKQVSIQRTEIDALKQRDVEFTQRGNERYVELRSDIKELKSSVSDIKESVAIVRGRMAEPSNVARTQR